ncbi:MAG: Ig-like domain-containing protein [Pyrinomonadaceae bacterium]|nr:Ig-like domain-containing protein [Pyrinomonadaceae bacterium]
MRAHRSNVLSRVVRIASSIILSATVIFVTFSGVVTAAVKPTVPSMFAVQTFGAGSLIIPMDSGANGQNNGMLRAYGLVYELLRRGVPVNWVINPIKGSNGTDFLVAAPNMIVDVRTGAVLAPRSYAGGPFVIDAADAAAAMPIIFAWQSEAGDQTAVHTLSFGSFSGDVSRRLVAAPRIAILKDGNETIAFNNLNAAGIRDSRGSVWASTSPDLLTEAAVTGPTTVIHDDGVLFHQSTHTPRYSYLTAMHYLSTGQTPEVVAEMRSWLDHGSLTHAFMQCEAARVVENSGFFLTTAGIVDDGSATTTPANRFPTSPLAQNDGAFEVDSGAVDSFRNNGGSYKTGVTTVFNDVGSPFTQRIVELAGRMDGDNLNGRVTYLAGHDYSTALPMSSNPQTNGVRLMLNTILETDAATTAPANALTITKSAPASVNTSQITYTITYTNNSANPVENIVITEATAAGQIIISMSPAATSIAGNVVTWNMPPLPPGGTGSITYTVVAPDGTYNSSATRAAYSTSTNATASSNIVTTIVDTIPPTVTITTGPSGTTTNATPTFTFTTGGSPVITVCRIDSNPPVSCSGSFTSPPLSAGTHTFSVAATDAAGNTTTATRTFTIVNVTLVSVNVVPVNVTILSGRTQQFNAFGIYSDGAVQDITNSVTWSSSNIAVARVSNAVGTQGLATGLAGGTVQIVARLGTVQGAATLTVTTLKTAKQAILAELRTALSTATSNKDKNNLKDAIKKLEKSLENSLWSSDGNHLSCDHGNKVFGRERSAVKSLMAMITDTNASNIPNTTISRWINVLVSVDRELAQIAVSEANVSANVRAAALAQIAEGDNDVADGDFNKAIAHYKRAWKKVRSCDDDDDDDEDDDDSCGRHGH